MTLPGPLGEGGRGLGQQTPLFPAQSSHPVLPHPLRRTPPYEDSSHSWGRTHSAHRRQRGCMKPSEMIPIHTETCPTLRSLQSHVGDRPSSCRSLSDGGETGFTPRNPILIGWYLPLPQDFTV